MSENTPTETRFDIRSEQRGPHWIAWLTAGTDPKPLNAVIIVGSTREEAESRARDWGHKALSLGYL